MNNRLRQLFLALLATAGMGGCTMDLPWGREIPAEDLLLKARTNKESISPGETLKLQVKLSNRSDVTGKLPALAVHTESLEIECLRGEANLCMDIEQGPKPQMVRLKPKEALFFEMEFTPQVEEGDDFVLKVSYQNRISANPVWISVPVTSEAKGYEYYEYSYHPGFDEDSDY